MTFAETIVENEETTKDERLCAKMEPTWGVDGGTLCDSVVEEAKMPPKKGKKARKVFEN